MIPGANRIVVGAKNGKLYVLDPQKLGGTADGDKQVPQVFLADRSTGGTNHIHGGPVFWSGPSGDTLYVWGENDFLRAYRLGQGGTFDANAASVSAVKPPDGMPGGMLAVSANGSAGGIVWGSHPSDGDANQAVRRGTLRAFDASDLTRELWNSAAKPEDDVGNFAKFVPPVVVDGKVFMATFSKRVMVYGLKP